jgi:hypothetical protein
MQTVFDNVAVAAGDEVSEQQKFSAWGCCLKLKDPLARYCCC